MRKIGTILGLSLRNMVSSHSIAFFDVDHTLMPCNSGYYTTLRLVRRGYMKKRRLIQAVGYSLISIFHDPDVQKVYKNAIADLVGLSLEELFKVGRETYDRDLKHLIYSEAINQIEHHRNEGHKIILLTSAPYMTMKILMDELKVDVVYCMGPEIENGILSNRLCLPLCYGTNKVHYAIKAAKKHQVDLKDCYFYTDHWRDVALLYQIGHPRVVNPKRKLEKIALEKKWPILRWKKMANDAGTGPSTPLRNR